MSIIDHLDISKDIQKNRAFEEDPRREVSPLLLCRKITVSLSRAFSRAQHRVRSC